MLSQSLPFRSDPMAKTWLEMMLFLSITHPFSVASTPSPSLSDFTIPFLRYLLAWSREQFSGPCPKLKRLLTTLKLCRVLGTTYVFSSVQSNFNMTSQYLLLIPLILCQHLLTTAYYFEVEASRSLLSFEG